MTWSGRIARGSKVLPKLIDVPDIVRAWKAGDMKQGLALGRDLLGIFHPGYADAAEEFAGGVTKAGVLLIGRLTGQITDGEVIGSPPWADFQVHYAALKVGVICIYGDPGMGKSEWAKKSLATWRAKDNFPVEFVNWYENDLPDFGYEITGQRVIARIRKVGKYLNQTKGPPVNDGLTDDELAGRAKRTTTPERRITQEEIDKMGYRSIAIDEAGIFFSKLGDAGEQDSREAAKRWSDQIRHLNTRLICIAQKQGDVPPHVRASAINIYKYASPGVIAQDFRPGSKRDTMQRWDEALTALHAVETGFVPDPLPKWMNEHQREAIQKAAAAHPYFQTRWPDRRMWGYAVGPLGGHFLRTVFPFDRYEPPEVLA